MNCVEKSINDRKYLCLDLIPVMQKQKVFYLAKILAHDLLKLYTVRPTEYDAAKKASFANSFSTDADYYQHLTSEIEIKEKDKDFQRRYDKKRVRDIREFLETKEYPFFPNTIIANCELLNDVQEFDLNEDSTLEQFERIVDIPTHLSFLYKVDGLYKLLIPYEQNAILVIDGQHRLRGLGECSDELKQNYELIVSFVIGFDRSVIAQQFYTINYEQKPVNKSLLYHLTGEFSTKIDNLTFMHQSVKVLNELEYSPFFQRIKMLGTNPPDATQTERARLSISQAFLIDYLLRYINKAAVKRKDMPIFLYYYQNEKYHIEIIRFIIKYFSAIKSIHPDWGNPTASVISKGMGVGGFIRALHTLFPIIFIRDWNSDPNKITEVTMEDLKRILAPTSNIDFSTSGPLGGVGSAGSINKIKDTILEKISYKDEGEIEGFREWLTKNA